MELARMRRGPILELGPPLAEDEACAFEQLVAPLERDLRQRLGERGRRDGRVVLESQSRLRLRLWRDEPADPQTRQSVDLGQTAGHDDALAASGERGTLHAVELRAAVDLVRQDPRAVLRRDRDDERDLASGQYLAGRVVRRADADELGLLVHRGGERIEVNAP